VTAAFGVWRLFLRVTLPSYRIIEVGVVSVLFYAIVSDRLPLRDRQFPRPTDATFLLGALPVGFLLRSLWSIVSPYPLGADTPNYLDLTVLVACDFRRLSELMLNGMEPLPLMIFGGLARVGLPVSLISRLVVPAVSTATLIPFYYLTKRMRDANTAQIATLILMVSPFQFRLILDLYRQVVAVFFLLCALYFLISERARYPWKTFLTAVATLLSHAAVFFVFVSVALLYCLFHKDSIVRRNLLLIAAAFVPLLFLWIPYSYWNRWLYFTYVALPTVIDILTPSSLVWHLMDKWHITFEVLEWGASLVVVGLIGLTRTRRADLPAVFILCIAFYVLLGIFGPPFFWREPDRWALQADIPLSILAADLITKTEKRQALWLALILLWVLLDSITFAAVYFKPWTTRTFDYWHV
jgi:hypothetical protein